MIAELRRSVSRAGSRAWRRRSSASAIAENAKWSKSSHAVVLMDERIRPSKPAARLQGRSRRNRRPFAQRSATSLAKRLPNAPELAARAEPVHFHAYAEALKERLSRDVLVATRLGLVMRSARPDERGAGAPSWRPCSRPRGAEARSKLPIRIPNAEAALYDHLDECDGSVTTAQEGVDIEVDSS